jgi:hypothetical protein
MSLWSSKGEPGAASRRQYRLDYLTHVYSRQENVRMNREDLGVERFLYNSFHVR